MSTADPSPRPRGKEHTRQSLILSALELLSAQSFDSLSLRQVTRQAGITPTAFYRHFDGMAQLGLVLVDESFRSWRSVLGQHPGDGDALARLLAVIVLGLHRDGAHFQFIVRERDGGVRELRRAIRGELQLFADQLSLDLAAWPGVEADDRRLVAGMITEAVIRMVADLLEAGPDEEIAIVDRISRQLRLISLGLGAAE
jgi:TetR/AcrR family transcriptional regulator, fatty acid biosynthesis regulator